MAKPRSDPLTFKASLGRLLDRYKEQMSAIVVQTVQEVSDRVITQWPVDTGYSRASWWTSVDGAPAAHPNPPTPGRSGAPGSAQGQPAVEPEHMLQAPGRVWGMKNNAVYAPKLEYGSSAQAPQGVIRVTLAQMPAIVREAAARVGVK